MAKELDNQILEEEKEGISEEKAGAGTEESKEGEAASTKEKEEKTYTEQDLEKIRKEEKEKGERALQEAVQNALKEEKRLSKLSQEERQKEEKEKHARELEEREKALLEKEKIADIKEELGTRKLPIAFAKYFVSETSRETLSKIKDFETTFKEAVQGAVDGRLKGTQMRTGDKALGQDIAVAKERNAKENAVTNPWA